jgi:Sap, sulfolipid-1-addressing protein
VDGGDRSVSARAGAGRWRRAGRRQPHEPAAGRGGAAAIAQTGISGGRQAIAYAVFAIVGTLGVGAPVGLYFAMGKRSGELLGGLEDWMGHHSAVILSGLCLVIGMKLLGDGLSRLSP